MVNQFPYRRSEAEEHPSDSCEVLFRRKTVSENAIVSPSTTGRVVRPLNRRRPSFHPPIRRTCSALGTCLSINAVTLLCRFAVVEI
ncbi:hypothetical protein HanIR_Chr02g0084331 [Helianthus annuus]|nr:hypothetical protein HanIR_Chr02g0084331 [Helianthus annuus]